MASGANVEQLGQLAQKLGIASEAEVQNTIATYALMESYGAGAITTEQLTAQFNNLSIAQKVAVSDTNLLAGAELEAEANARALADSIGASDAQFRQAASGAKEVASAVEAIPSHKKVTIEINTVEAARQVRSSVSGGHLQHGTTHWGGGLATVGETGPELVSLPRGSRVWNSQQSQRMSSGPTWNGNIVVQGASDPQAAAQAVLRALQDRGMLPRTALR